MATLASDLVAEARRFLLASGRQEMNRLTTTMNASVASVVFDFAAGSIAQGALIAIDLELMYVWSVTGSTATVQRAMHGSAPAAHTTGAVITVNPLVSDFWVFTEVNNEIASLSSPATGLYRIKTITRTMTVASTYDVAADVIDILAVQWNDYGPSLNWPRLRRWDVVYGQDTSVFASGVALQLYTAPPPGRSLRITYSAPFSSLATLADDVQTTTGLPASANDIPAIGAAARLLTAREARRSSLDAQPESRQAQDVPPGTARSSAQQLFALRDRRIKEESARLSSTYPTMTRPAG
jgi:hypothetical protein